MVYLNCVSHSMMWSIVELMLMDWFVCRLENNENIPCDLVILSSSEPDCICYIETKNLDGETNLKLRQGLIDTSWITTATDCATQLHLSVETEPPTTNMLRYQATVTIHPSQSLSENKITTSSTTGDTTFSIASTTGSTTKEIRFSVNQMKKIPINLNGTLLRGAVLRNTSWVIGAVVFTGDDTKQIMNSGTTPSKQTHMEKIMNPHMFVICRQFTC